jgi:hypothetical protein
LKPLGAFEIKEREPWPSYSLSTPAGELRLTELNQHHEAYETMSAAAARFPGDEIIPCDLACVCCALKRPDEPRTWLGKAIEAGGSGIKLKALDDPELEPLWREGATSSTTSTLLRSTGKNDLRKALDAVTRRS